MACGSFVKTGRLQAKIAQAGVDVFVQTGWRALATTAQSGQIKPNLIKSNQI